MTAVSFGDANSGIQIGTNQGPIYLPQPSKSRPDLLSTVPFPHNRDFISRDVLLDQLHKKASIQGSRVVLIGLGGVGKTQIAIEYCHWVQQRCPETWVFWIHTSNVGRFKESLRDLADQAEIPGRQDRNANIFQLIGNWLRDEKIRKWILVLDNVDDDELLRKPFVTCTAAQADSQNNTSTQPPLRYLLQSSNGSIIVTSQSKGVALDITDHKNLIEVQPMEKIEALALL
ncbi:hypothetical protein N7494_005889 [Penicillium frequentans]|uniref:NB-ARC domain-containing protein n=1 Tax=Penicillium frequentans TaxID=3151616 RepID=A0AAD6GFH5_9EURO|nr:hypothetical protein N7494_005889 [Penicillium glabrum]